MNRVHSLIDILYEIVIDFVTVFLACSMRLRAWKNTLTLPKNIFPPAALPSLPSLPSLPNSVVEPTKKRAQNIGTFMTETLSDLDEAAERTDFLLFFTISVIAIFIFGNILFYLALIS